MLSGSPLVQAIGLALVNFVWQGAALAVVTALWLAALKRSTAEARYLAACLGLAAMALAPIATTAYYASVEKMPPTAATSAPMPAPADATAASLSVPSADGLFTADVARQPFTGSSISSDRLRSWLPTIVVLWIGGVAALSLNLIRGWVHTRRLLRRAQSMSASVWPARMRIMADRLGMTIKVRLVKSALVDVPAVIGWLRPAILVPVSVIGGLSPAHLDAILAHERAHLRRRDYLVNLVQCVVETLLFYHPAVWWVSRRIRVEREHCCDDLAASLCDSRLTYATALASLETLRAATPALAMPATGGVLLHRIRRLVEPRCPSIPDFSGGFAMCVIPTLLLLVTHLPAMPPATRGTDVDMAAMSNVVGLPDVIAPTAVQPQIMTGSIAGMVTDQQGGTIPGATVTLVSAVSASGAGAAGAGAAASTIPRAAVKRSATTDPMGRFLFPDVPAGAHDITVTLVGFKTWRNRVQLASGQRAAMEVRLEVGSVSETILLRGSAPGAQVDVGQGANTSRIAAAHLEAARNYYEQGRLADAEAMTVRALELLRAEMDARSVPTVAPRDPPTGPIRVGGSIREPKKIRHIAPIYPPESQRAGIQGYVILEALIAKDGTVKEAKVLGATNGDQGLSDAALEAVRQWEYTPTLLNGVPVEVLMNVTVHFRLGG